MKKTLKVGFGEGTEKVTIESTGKKIYGAAVWIDKTTGKYYGVERYIRYGKAIERARAYSLTKEEFETL